MRAFTSTPIETNGNKKICFYSSCAELSQRVKFTKSTATKNMNVFLFRSRKQFQRWQRLLRVKKIESLEFFENNSAF